MQLPPALPTRCACGGVLNIEMSAVEETVLTPRDGLARRSRPALVLFCSTCDHAAEITTKRKVDA